MAISLESIQRSISGPPRLVIYGVPGIGKSTFAALAPKPVFLPVEDGAGDLTDKDGQPLNVPAFPKPSTYLEVVEAISSLVTGDHEFQTVVLDSLDKLEPLIWDHVCKRDGKDSIEAYGYGKGYVAAGNEWRNILDGFDALRSRGMTVILTAHSTVARVEPPETDPFDRYQLRLHKTAEALVCDWADAVLFANYKTVAVQSGPKGSERKRGHSDGTRALHCNEHAAWRAKNRYRMPDRLPLDWDEVAKFLPKTTTAVAAAS